MKAAVVFGASRGIGRQIALTLSENGYSVGVAAKTTQTSDKLPGSVHSVAKEIEGRGGTGLPIKCNVRSAEEIRSAISGCVARFGRLDLAVYNPGVINWEKVADTPLKQFDLMYDVNVRGAYIMIQEILQYFLKQKSGKILLVSPPIYSRFFKGKAPYSVSKVGATVLMHGLASELDGTGVSISSLWPATGIQSHVTEVYGVDRKLLRLPTIFADACLKIAEEKTQKLNGKALIDEDYLRSTGVTDFTQYRCHPEHEHPRMMPRAFPSLEVTEQDAPPVFSKL
ncbi:hydroxysteroid dehydrogenase-like protein 2 [Gigantopelta aegis]|uniref:hydroxysteroid dehydrogenase-like protein 2 n=1 Tax=Gigantopelta aegis TaxID=1735272 RepID=UPI001B88AB68|nr:hydroxysteroid dehydrogenase-like protein 2 [Gigantopelta aegis]